MWGTSSFCDELTGDFGGAFEATSIDGCRLFCRLGSCACATDLRRAPRQLCPETREPVGTPLVAADALVSEEQPLGVVALLDGCQVIEVRSPITCLPIGVEEISFRQIGTRAGRNGQKSIECAP